MTKYTFALTVMALVFFSACRPDDVPSPSNETKERTFLIYMAAQNSLGNYNGRHYDYENLESLLKGIKASHLQTNNVLIYHDPMVVVGGRADTRPRLLKVEMGSNGKAVTREIEIFVEQNSVSKEVMSAVINKVLKNESFAADHYSFLMWSHGSGWLPAESTRAIGQDGSNWMDINDFAAAIPDGVFDYIAVDACYMAAAEFAYALRNDADYLIASPTEIMGTGMPYELMPNYLLGATPNYNGFCDAFYNYYPEYGSTLSLIKLGGMEALAGTVRNILSGVSMEQLYAIPSAGMQHFDRIGTTGYSEYIFFDLGSFVKQLDASAAQLQRFEQALAAAVPYERHSDSFLLGHSGFQIKEYSGLSVYVPRNTTASLRLLNEYYQTQAWYRAVL